MTAYSTSHAHVAATRGPAREHACRCGRPARQWAYDHLDENELHSPEGWPYSTDVAHYEALCVPCHKTEDLRRLGRARTERTAA